MQLQQTFLGELDIAGDELRNIVGELKNDLASCFQIRSLIFSSCGRANFEPEKLDVVATYIQEIDGKFVEQIVCFSAVCGSCESVEKFIMLRATLVVVLQGIYAENFNRNRDVNPHKINEHESQKKI